GRARCRDPGHQPAAAWAALGTIRDDACSCRSVSCAVSSLLPTTWLADTWLAPMGPRWLGAGWRHAGNTTKAPGLTRHPKVDMSGGIFRGGGEPAGQQG